ncbi:WxL domain-containing protein, partial [Enterococcus faecalis]
TTPITAVRQWVQEGGASGTVDSLQSVRYRTIYADKSVYFNRLSIPEMTYPDTLGLEYGLRDITITLPKWYKGLSFVRPTHSIYPASFSYRYTNNGQDLNASFAIKQEAAGQSMVVTSQPNIYQVRHGV